MQAAWAQTNTARLNDSMCMSDACPQWQRAGGVYIPTDLRSQPSGRLHHRQT